jgi:serine/threonine protein kinase/Rieske Fe-S protein
MQTVSSNQLTGQILGNYRIERFLGQGRLNAIYLARNLTEQRLDALTFYIVPEHFSSEARTRFLQRFRKETAAITSLDHPHILPVYDHGDLAGNPYLVTPYMMHGSLVDLLKRRGKYDHHSVLPILEQIASGLAYAHSNGFIHGTLRPSTMVLSPENALRVAGFGLMHMLQLGGIESDERSNSPYPHLLSIAETFLVAPEYVAPEIVQGQSIDVRSDIYALGCILFELLSGRPPFIGKDPLEIINKHITEAVPLLHIQNPEVPIAVASVVNQSLERAPVRRFQHVLELIEAFRQASRGATNYAMSGTKRQTTVLKQAESLHDSSQDISSSNKWQLVPPIVTGKHAAARLSERAPVSEMPTQTINTDHWRAIQSLAANQPSATTSGKVPSVSAPVAPKENTSLSSEQEAVSERSTQSVNTGPWRTMQSLAASQPSATASGKVPSISPLGNGSGEDVSSLVEAYSWWSLPGVISSLEPQTKQVQPDRPQAPREPLRLPNSDTVKREDDASLPYPLSPISPKGASAQPKIKRRRAIALLAAGGVGVAVGIAALNLKPLQHLLGIASNQGQTQPNAAGQVHSQTQVANAGISQKPGHMGTVIGQTTLALNATSIFTNPADGQGSLLIHLPDNRFVAYERACTHEQVPVYYDTKTKELVCPAHGAIFDPARGGAVVQGPATQPLPSVKISVNSDGTIMAG